MIRFITILLRTIAVALLAFVLALYIADPDAASKVASSCSSCKKPTITFAAPKVVDHGWLSAKDWRILPTMQIESVAAPELASGEQQKIAIGRVNYYRNIVGLKPITLNSELNRAAAAHASYNVEHNLSGHTETKGAAGFSGVWPWDRMENKGYDTFNYATEVCSTRWASADYLLTIDPKWAVDGWVDTVYHRLPIISPDVYESGFGARQAANRVAYVMDFGNPGVRDAKKIVCYPVNGQTNIPVEFAGDEKPDPLPGKQYPVGYPITVTFNGYKKIVINQTKLADASGAEIDSYILLPFSDEHIRETLAIVPKQPLLLSATYNVEVSAVVDGKPVELKWVFTTSDLSQRGF